MADIKWNGKEFTKKVIKITDNALMKSALLVERTAKKKCPVKTGSLKRSIISNWSGSKRARSASWPTKEETKAGKTTLAEPELGTAIIGTNMAYAPFVELGTSKMKSQSFLRAALEENSEKIANFYKGK